MGEKEKKEEREGEGLAAEKEKGSNSAFGKKGQIGILERGEDKEKKAETCFYIMEHGEQGGGKSRKINDRNRKNTETDETVFVPRGGKSKGAASLASPGAQKKKKGKGITTRTPLIETCWVQHHATTGRAQGREKKNGRRVFPNRKKGKKKNLAAGGTRSE